MIKDYQKVEDSKNIEYSEDEKEDVFTDDAIFEINSWGADLSYRELTSQYNEGDIIKPELQRKYVWSKVEASRFIESILLGLPVPSIFLAKAEDEKLLIIDGYQRLMSVNDFFEGVFSKDESIFKLTRSETIHERWRGKSFKQLSEKEQRRLKTTTIHAIIFEQTRPTDHGSGMYQIFERINTGGRVLSPQEIRNCINQGSFNDFLFEVNKYPNWRKIFGRKSPEDRMRDIEFILRFFALRDLENYYQETNQTLPAKISFKKYLTTYMNFNRNPSEVELKNFSKDFVDCVDFLFDCFGEQAFHNISPSDINALSPKFNANLFDSIMIATHKKLKTRRGVSQRPTEENRRDLLTDQIYQDTIKIETNKVKNIKKRISLASKYLFG